MESRAASPRYGPIFEAAPEAIFVLEAPSGRILEVNRRMTELYGHSKQEARRLTIEELSDGHPPFSGAEASEWVRRAGERPQRFEWLSKHRSGRLFWSEVSIKRVSLEGEDRFLAIVRDTSARKHAEEQLQASEERLRATFEQAAVGMLHVALDGRFLRVNPRLCELIGYPPEELLALPREALDLPEDRASEAASRGRLLAGEAEWLSRERRFRRKDGTLLWCLLTVSLVRDAGGAPQYFVAVLEDLSERKLAEERLRQSEEWLRTLFEQMVAAFSVLELVLGPRGEPADFLFLDANPAFERVTGLSRGQVLGKRLREVLPGIEPWWSETFGEVALTGEPAHLEGYLLPLDRYLEVNAYRPAPGQLAMTFNDVSERHRAEQAREKLLREMDAQRALLQAIVENAPAIIALLRGPQLLFELVNPALQRQIPIQLVGRPLCEVAGLAAPALLPIAQEVLRTGEPSTVADLPLSGPDGRSVFFGFTVVRLQEPGAQQPAVLLIGSDTTEQVRSRRQIEALAAAAQRKAAELQSVIDNMVEGVFVFDRDARPLLANDSGLRLLGTTRERLAEFDFDALPPGIRRPDGRPVRQEELALSRALAGETVAQLTEFVVRPGQERASHLRVSAAPIHDGRGRVTGAVEVVRDVSELVELDRLKDEFILVASHELKTPVAIMKGYAQTLARLPEGAVAPRKVLQAIDRGAGRLDALVHDLLDVSQLSVGTLPLAFERVDLAELVSEVSERTALEAGRRIELVGLAPAVIEGDRERLAQTLRALLDNALVYSPAGEEVEVRLAVEGSEAVVAVRDRGVGIPRERQARIFQRFYRAHTHSAHDYGGMGVGLYIAREIVTRHRGRIWFESDAGKGSTFSFSLPLPGPRG